MKKPGGIEMRARDGRAALSVVVVAAAALLTSACEKKSSPPPSQQQLQIGSVVVNLPPDLKVPLPQGRPDEASVNATKCNYVVDKQIGYLAAKSPQYKPALLASKPQVMQECETKWTQPEYDCMVAAKAIEQFLDCKKYQKP